MSTELTTAKADALEELKKYMSPAAASNLLRVIQLQGYSSISSSTAQALWTAGFNCSSVSSDVMTVDGLFTGNGEGMVLADGAADGTGVYRVASKLGMVESSASTDVTSIDPVDASVSGLNVYAPKALTINHNLGKTNLTAIASVTAGGVTYSWPCPVIAVDANNSSVTPANNIPEGMFPIFGAGTLDETATCTIDLIEIG